MFSSLSRDLLVLHWVNKHIELFNASETQACFCFSETFFYSLGLYGYMDEHRLQDTVSSNLGVTFQYNFTWNKYFFFRANKFNLI